MVINSRYTRIHDLHNHNGYYRGTGEIYTAAEAWQKASIEGIHQLGLANKVEFNHPNQDFIPLMYEEIKSLNNNSILLGIELDLGHPSGQIVLEENNCKYLDYVLAAPHNQPAKTLAWDELDDEDKNDYFDSYNKMLVNSFKSGIITIWAHPYLQELEISGGHYQTEIMESFQLILETCIQKNIALEINENYFRKTEPDKNNQHWWKSSEEYYHDKINLLQMLFEQALQNTDLEFSFGSDTHHLKSVGDIQQAINFAHKLEIPESRILVIEK